MINKTHLKSKGFTLTELMFAMAFLAFVMIFVVTTIVQTMRIYNKGLAIREINQAGRQFSEEFTRTLKYADAEKFRTGGYNAGAQRICANGVSYAWNIEDQTVKNRYNGGDSRIPIQLIRVNDKSGGLCSGGDIQMSESRDILSSQLSVQSLTFDPETESGRIVTMKVVISTTGTNRPNVSVDVFGGKKYECPAGGDGAFCAFGEFRSTTYVRN